MIPPTVNRFPTITLNIHDSSLSEGTSVIEHPIYRVYTHRPTVSTGQKMRIDIKEQ